MRTLSLLTAGIILSVFCTGLAAETGRTPQISSVYRQARSSSEDIIHFRNQDVLRGRVVNESISIATQYGLVSIPIRKCAGISFQAVRGNAESIVTVNFNRLTGIIIDNTLQFMIGSSGKVISIRKEKIKYIVLQRTASETDFLDNHPKSDLFVMVNGDILSGEVMDRKIIISTAYAKIQVEFSEMNFIQMEDGDNVTVVINKSNGETMRGALDTEELSIELELGTSVESIFKGKFSKVFVDNANQQRLSQFMRVASVGGASGITIPDAAVPHLIPLPVTLPKPTWFGAPVGFAGVDRLERFSGKPCPAFLAPIDVKNVAFGKPVTALMDPPIMGELSQIVDGDKEATGTGLVDLGPMKQWVQIDLGKPYELWAILLWHFHKQPRVYFDVVVQVADDPEFIINVRTLFNNDSDNSSGLGVGKDKNYVDTYEGKLVDAKKQVAQYVRLYSNENNLNDRSHYLEVEVYGRDSQDNQPNVIGSGVPVDAIEMPSQPAARPSLQAENKANEATLREAALEGLVQQIQTLLKQGTNANAAGENGRTALMLAAFNGYTGIVQELIKYGANIDTCDQIGRTALIYAASGPNSEVVEFLLTHKANPNVVDKEEEWTALMFAAAEGHKQVVSLLLKHGADATLQDTDGETASDFAANAGHSDVARMLAEARDSGN